MTMTFWATVLAILATTVNPTYAISANPNTFRVTQPSTGKNITLRLQGGEHFHWLSEGQGIDAYTVVRNDGGDFVYAELLSDGTLGPTMNIVGDTDLEEKSIPKNLVMSDEVRDRICMSRKLLCSDLQYDEGFNETQEKRRLQSRTPTEGNITNLVVLMRWSDHEERTLPSVEDIDVLMNTKGPHVLAPTGSVRDVFMINSYGKLNLTSVVYKWVDMDNTEKFYADGDSGTTSKIQDAIKYALQQLEDDSCFDFGVFDKNKDGYIDAIAFLHSGYGAEWGGFDSDSAYYEDRIWSHKWSLSSYAGEFQSAKSGVKVNDYHISPALWSHSGSRMGRIGVIAHETGRFLGLPDLYDTQWFGQGIGNWCLMANSWGFDGSQYYPPQLSAWSRIQLGWDNATVIEKDGVYRVAASEITEDVRDPRIYRINEGYPEGEYLLIENRQPLMYDSLIPQGGLAVWHVDLKQVRGQGRLGFPGQEDWPQNGNHYRIALLQSDTDYQLEKRTTQGDRGDLFHADGEDEIKASLATVYGPYPNTGECGAGDHVFFSA